MAKLGTIKQLETQVKVTWFLYFYDLVFIVGYTFFSYEFLVGHVHSNFQKLYLINCILWGITLILPASDNAQRKNWQNIINTLINMYTGKTYSSVKGEVNDYDIR